MRKFISLLIIESFFIQMFFGAFTIVSAQVQRNKLTLAVLPLDAKGGISPNEAKTLSDRLRTELVNLGYFTIIERGKMSEILEEQGFNLTGCVSSECAVEAGRMLGVRIMVTGDVGAVGDVITVDVRMIDVETGKILRALQYDHEGNVSGLLDLMRRVALQLVGKEDPGEKGISTWLWITLGAVVVGGGLAALLLTGGENGAEPPPPALPDPVWPPPN
jgi:TolB-like protein